jgi:hypothetical protein
MRVVPDPGSDVDRRRAAAHGDIRDGDADSGGTVPMSQRNGDDHDIDCIT